MKFEKHSHGFRPNILKSTCTKYQNNPTIVHTLLIHIKSGKTTQNKVGETIKLSSKWKEEKCATWVSLKQLDHFVFLWPDNNQLPETFWADWYFTDFSGVIDGYLTDIRDRATCFRPKDGGGDIIGICVESVAKETKSLWKHSYVENISYKIMSTFSKTSMMLLENDQHLKIKCLLERLVSYLTSALYEQNIKQNRTGVYFFIFITVML